MNKHKSVNEGVESYSDDNESILDFNKQRKRVFNLIHQERQYQQQMAKLRGWSVEKSANDWIAIMQHELDEAKEAYFTKFTSHTRNVMYHEILQVVAVGVACLESINPAVLEQFWKLSDPDKAREKFEHDKIRNPDKLR